MRILCVFREAHVVGSFVQRDVGAPCVFREAREAGVFVCCDVGAPCVFREARKAGVFVYCEGSFRVAAACRGPKAERAQRRVAKVVPS